MDDIDLIFKARQTVVEMLQDRKYTIPESLLNEKIGDFKTAHSNKRLDIYVTNPSKCYVKFVLLHKVRPNILREYITQLKESHLDGDEGTLVLVLRSKPNNTLYKLTSEFRNLQIFWLRNLIINITHHSLVPKFEKLEESEIEHLLHQYKLTSRNQLPMMFRDDPISQYFGYKSGNVCRIKRNSVTSGEYITYRCVKQ
jgi:DNA-directed RNA polymerase I, II, and III subunit RPABC1